MSFAQKKTRQWDTYLTLGTGISNHKVIDRAVSPIQYSGSLYTGEAGFIKESAKWLIRASFGGGMGDLKSSEVLGSVYLQRSYTITGELSTAFSIKKLSSNRLTTYLGPAYLFNGDIRINSNLQNAARQHNLASSFGITSTIQYPFQLKPFSFKVLKKSINFNAQKFKLNFQGIIPVFITAYRPPFSVISDFTDGKGSGSFFENSSNSTIGSNALILRTRSELYWYFSNSNAVRFGYIWQLNKIEDTFTTVTTAHHLFQFSFLIRLNQVHEK